VCQIAVQPTMSGSGGRREMVRNLGENQAFQATRLRAMVVSLFVTGFMLLTAIPMLGSVQALETELFSDNFDNDNLISPWTAQVGVGNTLEIAEWPAWSPPHCLHAKKVATNSEPARATSPYIQLNYDADYWIDVKFRLSTDMYCKGMLIADDGRVYVNIPSGYTLQIVGSGIYVNVPVTTGHYYILRAMVHPSEGTYDVKMYGTEYDWDTVANDIPFYGVPHKHLSIGTDEYVTTKYYGEVFFDDVSIIGSEGPAWSDEFDCWDNWEGAVGDWTTDITGTGIVETSSTLSYSPPNALHVKYGGTGNRARATTPVINCDFNLPYVIEMKYRYVNGKLFVVADDGRLEVQMIAGVLYAVKSNGGTVTIGAVSYGVWHTIEIHADPIGNYFTVWVDGVQLGASYAFKSDIGLPTLTLGSKVDVGRRDSGEAYWDDMSVIGTTVVHPDSDGDGLVDSIETYYGTDLYGCKRWAVLVCGGIGDELQDDFEDDADLAYQTLKRIGYSDASIYYLSYPFSGNLWRDADGDGIVDVDNTAHDGNVAYAFSTWLPSVADKDDRIFVFFIDHGGEHTFAPSSGYLALHETVLGLCEEIDDVDTDAWFDSLWNNNRYDRLVCLVDCCYSGNWLYGTGVISGSRRVVITTSLNGETTHVGVTPGFFYDVLEGLSVEEAYANMFEDHPHTIMNDQCNPDTDPNGWIFLA